MGEIETGIPVNSSGGDMASSKRLSYSVRVIRPQSHAHSLVVAGTSRESVVASKRRHRVIDTATWQPLAREVVELRKMRWGLRRTILITPDSRDPRENNPTRRDPEA
jgi:hypothetical protein